MSQHKPTKKLVRKHDVEAGPVVERFLDDYREGEIQDAGPITVTAREIIEFAENYDPLPMHINVVDGEATVHDSLISSGVLTIALKQRLIMSIERNSAIIGAVRIDNQQFLKRSAPETSCRCIRFAPAHVNPCLVPTEGLHSGSLS